MYICHNFLFLFDIYDIYLYITKKKTHHFGQSNPIRFCRPFRKGRSPYRKFRSAKLRSE